MKNIIKRPVYATNKSTGYGISLISIQFIISLFLQNILPFSVEFIANKGLLIKEYL